VGFDDELLFYHDKFSNLHYRENNFHDKVLFDFVLRYTKLVRFHLLHQEAQGRLNYLLAQMRPSYRTPN